MTTQVYIVGTLDTKGPEVGYVRDRLLETGTDSVVVDVGTLAPPSITPDIAREKIAEFHPEGSRACLGKLERGEAVTAMSIALAGFLTHEHERCKLGGVLGLGGSGGTALITRAMQALPIGVPKLMVSTVASGDTRPYVGCCDITMMYSVVDVCGLNVVSRRILANAAQAMSGMARPVAVEVRDRPCLGMTMFGVTTPCVSRVRELLEQRDYDCLVFHATGTGGRAMEKLVQSRMISGVLDITTTEVADEIAGGVFPSGPERFDAILQSGVPYVVSLGALDMVNFGALPTVPAQYRDRKLHVHNSNVTLMRTSVEENRRCARWIADKLNTAHAPVVVLIPEKGVSYLDAAGQPFYDTEADSTLFSELEACVHQSPDRRIRRLPMHINDAAFSEVLVAEFLALAQH
jgi:uncharacterized protein (UPF0261 family)